MANAENLTQEGGDRFAARRAMIAVIAESLAEGSDEEIREAFHLPKWRAISPARRARYAEYFAPRIYAAMVAGMRRGLVEGRLDIGGFGVFEWARGRGELFPVTVGGPCYRARMLKETVTFTESSGNYMGEPITGTVPAGQFTGPWDGDGEVSQVGVFEVLGKKSEAVLTKTRTNGAVAVLTVNALDRVAVLGRAHTDRSVSPPVSWLEIIDGDLPAGYAAGKLTAGDVRAALEWRIPARRFFDLLDGYPKIMTHAAAVFGGYEWAGPVSLWAEGFPRVRWVERVVNAQGVAQYLEIEWLTRAEWIQRYGAYYDDYLDDGAIVPSDAIIGERGLPLRVYAKFDVEFIDELQLAEP